LRLIEAADRDDFFQRAEEVMAHPKLAEIVRFTALFGYGAIRAHHNGCSPIVDGYLQTERRLAEDLDALPTFETNHIERERDNNMTVKVRMLIELKNRTSLGAPDVTYDNLKRGDVVEATESEAERYVRLGYAVTDPALLKCDIRDLPAPYRTPIWQR
jgi:hypothetical protein